MGATLFDLVCLALPPEVAPEDLRKLAPEAEWLANPEATLGRALRACPAIDWQAYLARYPDVAQAGFDPCQHFLSDGLYEGRKLASGRVAEIAPQAKRPQVSIIIANYNNAATLLKCLASALGQTLKDIEVIAVDDCSGDGSVKIIKNFMARNKRLKLIENATNEGPFEARRKGLMASTGSYIMFLDSDDFLPPDACAIALSEAKKGYDIVDGGALVIARNRLDALQADALANAINVAAPAEYNTAEALHAVFISNQLTWTLWGKLFARDVCIKAYNSLDTGFYLMGEDGYATLALLRFARNLKKIPQKLYCYNYGCGVSANSNQGNYLARSIRGEAVKAMGEYAKRYGLNIGFEAINKQRCRDALRRWLECAPASQAGELFARIKDLFGFGAVMATLLENWSGARRLVAKKYQYRAMQPVNLREKKKHIGIFYHCLSVGGVERIISDLAHYLAKNGYEITVFIERRTDTILPLPPKAELIYLRDGFGDAANVRAHVEDFEGRIKAKPIDLMLYMAAYAPYSIWDIILLHHYNIPVIAANHGTYAMPFIKSKPDFSYHVAQPVLRCADAVICLSSPGELYARLHGINAWRVANPVHPDPAPTKRQKMPRAIAVMGRLGDPLKRIGESLLVLLGLVRAYPDTKMLLIGDFNDASQRQEFLERIRQLGISDNVRLTGWADNPGDYLDQCGVLLSTSYCESFGLAIGEAQAKGLPCVIYDLPIEQAEDNESIISVAQDDHEGAASAIADLFEDQERWQKLSAIARQKAARFSPEGFYGKMREIVENFDRYTPWQPYSRKDYADIIKYSAFYAGHKRPEGLW